MTKLQVFSGFLSHFMDAVIATLYELARSTYNKLHQSVVIWAP